MDIVLIVVGYAFLALAIFAVGFILGVNWGSKIEAR